MSFPRKAQRTAPSLMPTAIATAVVHEMFNQNGLRVYRVDLISGPNLHAGGLTYPEQIVSMLSELLPSEKKSLSGSTTLAFKSIDQIAAIVCSVSVKAVLALSIKTT